MADIVKARYGPCGDAVSKVFIEIKTNEHGTLEVHPCSWCNVVFVRHADMNWVLVKDETLADRVKREVRNAADNGAAGFEKFKTDRDKPVYVKGFME